MKTFILTWTQSPCNLVEGTPGYLTWGLGDLLRSTIGALRFCEQAGYECIVDVSLHPIATLLNVKEHRFSEQVKANKDRIFAFNTYELVSVLDMVFKQGDVFCCFAHWGINVYETPVTPRIVAAIEELLTPNAIFTEYIQRMRATIPSPYTILHFRLGDTELIQGVKPTEFVPYIQMAKNHMETTDILLSDSTAFKEKAVEQLPIYTFKEPVAHLGVHAGVERIQHTLFEFLLLTKAVSIKSYSVHPWSSGFATIASYLYGIPLIKIQ